MPDGGLDVAILAGRLRRELLREPSRLLVKLQRARDGAVACIAEVRPEVDRCQIGIPLLAEVYFVCEVYTEQIDGGAVHRSGVGAHVHAEHLRAVDAGEGHPDRGGQVG